MDGVAWRGEWTPSVIDTHTTLIFVASGWLGTKLILCSPINIFMEKTLIFNSYLISTDPNVSNSRCGPRKGVKLKGLGRRYGLRQIRMCNGGHVGRLCAGLAGPCWLFCVDNGPYRLNGKTIIKMKKTMRPLS